MTVSKKSVFISLTPRKKSRGVFVVLTDISLSTLLPHEGDELQSLAEETTM